MLPGRAMASITLRKAWAEPMAEILAPYQAGNCAVYVDYHAVAGRAKLMLGSDWRVRPSDELLQSLRDQFGRNAVHLHYR